MGYTANGYGTILFRTSGKEYSDKIEKMLSSEFEVCLSNETDKELEIAVSHCGNFRGDDVLALLEKFEESTIEGEIEMTGEDDCQWRYRFAKEYGKWVEEEGSTVFEVYSKDENGMDSYSIPVYVLVLSKWQTEYTEPMHYEQAEDAREIIKAFTDRETAEMECSSRNEKLGAGDNLHYEIFETKLKV